MFIYDPYNFSYTLQQATNSNGIRSFKRREVDTILQIEKLKEVEVVTKSEWIWTRAQQLNIQVAKEPFDEEFADSVD